jgi:hypothetical protein
MAELLAGNRERWAWDASRNEVDSARVLAYVIVYEVLEILFIHLPVSPIVAQRSHGEGVVVDEG